MFVWPKAQQTVYSSAVGLPFEMETGFADDDDGASRYNYVTIVGRMPYQPPCELLLL